MKKRYPFLPKNWLRFGWAAAFATAFSLNLQAQTAPIKQWDRTFGGSNIEQLFSLKQTVDGGFILGGFSQSTNSGDKTEPNRGNLTYDFWIVKTDASGTKIWDKTFGGSDNDYLYTLQQTIDGGFILGGYSNSLISGEKTQNSSGWDYWVVKLDMSGNKIWDKSFGGSGRENLYSLTQTTDGGYMLAGYSDSPVSANKTALNKGGNDYWVVRLDGSGNKLWDKSFGGSSSDRLSSIQQTSDGGFILGGDSNSSASGDKSQVSKGQKDYWVIKLDVNGNQVWDKTIGGSGDENLITLQQTSDGGYVLGGTSASDIGDDKTQDTQGLTDFWIVKIDGAGTKIWDKTINGSGIDNLYTLKQTTDGGYLLGGDSNSGIGGDKTESSRGGVDFWTVKLNANGNIVWDKTFGGSGDDYLLSLLQTSDGGFILGGDSDSGLSLDKMQPSQGFSDYWIIKLAGNLTGIEEPKTSFNLTISPNPNQGKFQIQLNNLTAAKAEVTVSDLLGRVVLQKEIQTTNNQLSKEFTLPNTKGIYLLQLKAGEHMLTRKIVVE